MILGLLIERNLTISLREMQVSNGKFRTLDVDGQINLTASRKVLDVAVASMLWPSRNCTCSFSSHFFLDVLGSGPGVDVLRSGWDCDLTGERCGRDQFLLPPVPLCQYLGRRSTAKDTWMDQASKFHARNMAGSAVDAFEVPYCFSTGALVSIHL